VFVIAFAILAVAVATLPIWFRWVLSPVLGHFGIHYSTYEAVGWTRFALVGVRGDYEDVWFTSARVEAPLPTGWLLGGRAGAGEGGRVGRASDWRIHIEPKPRQATNGEPSSPNSTAVVIDNVESVFEVLRLWVPQARATNGVVEFGTDRISVAWARWSEGQATASARSSRLPGVNIELRANLATNSDYHISAHSGSPDAVLDLVLKRVDSRWDLNGRGLWRTNQVDVSGRFEREGWWPKQAQVTAPSFRVPADVFEWEGYEDGTGSFALNWGDGSFEVDVSAAAKPTRAAPRGYPPVNLVLKARGDLDSVAIEELKLVAPGVQASLSERLDISRSGNLVSEAATLKLSLDLAKLPWLSMGGAMQGVVRVRQGRADQVRAGFELSGTKISRGDLMLKEVTLAGELDGPLLSLRRVEVKLDDGSAVGGSVRIDLKTRSAIEGRWKFQGRLPGPWAPEQITYSALQTTGEFSGPLGRLKHSGRLEIEKLVVPMLESSAAKAAWRGEGFDLSEAEVELRAGGSRLMFGGALRAGGAETNTLAVSLRKLSYERRGELLYGLKKPFDVSFLQRTGREGGWSAKVSGFEWAGAGRVMTFVGETDWPRRGALRVHWRGVAIDDFADLIRQTLPASCVVSNLDVKAAWDDGPVKMDVSGAARLATRDGTPFVAQAKVSGDVAGIKVERVLISGTAGDVFSVEGNLPAELVPGLEAGWLRWNEKKAIDLRAFTAPNDRFWDGVAGVTGARFSKPELNLSIRGTLARPMGLLSARAERLAWEPSTNHITPPTLENLKADAEFQRDSVQLKSLTVELEGQPVRARGDLPLGKTFWTDLVVKGGMPNWRDARGQVEIVDARLGLFARYLPDILSPQGRLSLELALQPGARVEGELQITNAATRPLMPLGRIHEIEASVRFHDRAATIQTFRGEIGGQPVNVTGGASLVEKAGLQFEATLKGTNVPLVREAGVLIRSDLDIQLAQKTGQPATVSGDVVLRDSLYLQELKSLVPGGPSRQSMRPPYFSVKEKPFADWRLNLRIRGNRGLRVRTPLFRGEISVAMQLSGTMREPMALGEVSIASGQVQFPFGNLTMDRGYVSLTSENPYRPALFITASGYTYGYSIKMEMTGPADEPRMTFSSTPPLTSEQIVLMLTAGELPRAEFALTDQQRAAQLGVFLGKDFLTRFLGSDSAADRLTLRSGEQITDEGNQTYYLEYRLTKDWSVVGEYDRFNELNAGLKWKIFSK